MTATIERFAKKGNKRSSARLAAVQALYQMDAAGNGVEETVKEFEKFRLGKEVGGDIYSPADAGFFRDIVRGVVREQLKLDPLIDEALAKGWPLVRIDLTLRQVLRAGLYELLHRKDVPAKAAIAEYIDVAQAFFAEGDEVKLANALLDALARKYRAEEFG
jgi:N utilization substance protein B